MKIIKNEKLIKRNSMIGQWTSIGGFIIIGVGMYFYLTNLNKPEMLAKYDVYYFIAVGVAFMLTQVGTRLGNRFGASPRPDEKIDAALKGLPGDFTVYHFVTPASYLLVGPAGIWVLLPFHQRGVVTYTKNRWHIDNGDFIQRYLSIFGGQGIGRPDWDAESEISLIQKLFAKKINKGEIPEIKAVLIFMHNEADLKVEGAPLPAMKIKQLKDFMRQKAKEKPISATQLAAIKSALPE